MTAPSDDQLAAIAELHDSITAARPGTPAIWVHDGVEVSVYGQRRWDLEFPTPWATITIAGRIRPVHTWLQILEEIDELNRKRSSDV